MNKAIQIANKLVSMCESQDALYADFISAYNDQSEDVKMETLTHVLDMGISFVPTPTKGHLEKISMVDDEYAITIFKSFLLDNKERMRQLL